MINAYSVQTGESQCLNIDHCYVKFKPIGRIDTARMEDHLNSNLDPSVPLSVYQVTERERERVEWSAWTSTICRNYTKNWRLREDYPGPTQA